MKKGRFVVITASGTKVAKGVKDNELEKEIREEVEKITIPWVKDILKVTISDYLFED